MIMCGSQTKVGRFTELRSVTVTVALFLMEEMTQGLGKQNSDISKVTLQNVGLKYVKGNSLWRTARTFPLASHRLFLSLPWIYFRVTFLGIGPYIG